MNHPQEKQEIIQCCYCKANNVNNPLVHKFFNLEKANESVIAHGCSNCLNCPYDYKGNLKHI